MATALRKPNAKKIHQENNEFEESKLCCDCKCYLLFFVLFYFIFLVVGKDLCLKHLLTNVFLLYIVFLL